MKLVCFYLAVVFCLFTLLNPGKIFAQELIRNFAVQITAHRDGTMEVKENIAYDFGSQRRHGIYRQIPLISQVGNLYRVIQVSFNQILRDNQAENFASQIDNSQASIKIGRSDFEIYGLHNYTLFYIVKNGIGSNYADHDEIYWNVTGNAWLVPILAAEVNLRTDFGVMPQKAVCYSGVRGSTANQCDASQISLIKTTDSLRANEGLTGVWGFPKGTFPPSFLQNNKPVTYKVSSDLTDNPAVIKTFLYGLLAVYLLLNLVLAPGLIFWYLKKKHKKRFGPPMVNFDLPKIQDQRISPAQAGSIDNYQVDQNDVVATIFDLAIRQYLKIEQVKEEKVLGIFGGGEDYQLVKLKGSWEETTAFEKLLLDCFFEDGDNVRLSAFRQDFYLTFAQFRKKVFASLINQGFYQKDPQNQMVGLMVLGLLTSITGSLILGPVLIFLSRKLNGRTALGDEMDWKLDGLKIFLKNMTRYYTWQAKNLYTVERYIPYAIAFGFIKEFMEQLKIIYPDYQPVWYSGNLAFYNVSNQMFSSMGSAFVTSAPSSSSGFSGGGSSGGGGGGGGGGSW